MHSENNSAYWRHLIILRTFQHFEDVSSLKGHFLTLRTFLRTVLHSEDISSLQGHFSTWGHFCIVRTNMHFAKISAFCWYFLHGKDIPLTRSNVCTIEAFRSYEVISSLWGHFLNYEDFSAPWRQICACCHLGKIATLWGHILNCENTSAPWGGFCMLWAFLNFKKISKLWRHFSTIFESE